MEEEIDFMWTTKPEKFGTFHIVFIVIAVLCLIVGTYLGYKLRGEKNARKRDWVAAGTGFFLLALEVFRVIYSFCVGETSFEIVSFQICALPIYLLPLFVFFKKGFFKDCLVGHIAYVNTVGVIGYFVNPAAMLRADYIARSVESGVFHVVLMGVCAFVFVAYEGWTKKGILNGVKGFGLFFLFTLIAVAANFIIHAVNPDSALNLFYLYPYSATTYPILDTIIRPNVPYPVYYILFLVFYFVLCCVPYLLFAGIEWIKNKIQGRKKNETV